MRLTLRTLLAWMDDTLPPARVREIGAMDGVVAATPFQWYGGKYHDEVMPFAQFAIDADGAFDVLDEYKVEPAELADFKANVASFGSRVGLFTATNAGLEALINQNFFPASMVSGTAPNRIVTNQWGGSYTVAIGTISNAGDALVLTSGAIPAFACTELGTSLNQVATLSFSTLSTTRATSLSLIGAPLTYFTTTSR